MDLNDVEIQKWRTRCLDIIKSVKRHLHRPKVWEENLYYIPPYEKGLILCAVKMLKKMYFNPETDVAALNSKVFKFMKLAASGKFDDLDSEVDL